MKLADTKVHGRKPEHYFKAYEEQLVPYMSKPINVLEIGVQSGDALRMWMEYLPLATFTGIDIDPNCGKPCRVVIGDQSNRDFLKEIVRDYGPFDIIMDDGGHTMEQQLTSFDELFPTLNKGGLYVIEDTHTSYWHEFGGSLGGNTTVEFLKKEIDKMHYSALVSPRAHRESHLRRSQISYMGIYESIIFLKP